MNDSLHDLQSDIHRLAQQHSQIQIMMNQPKTPPSAQRPTQNPLDPQPFYISSDSPQQPHPQRRTWGQPQPISFAQQGGGMMNVDWQQQPPRQRQQWGGPPQEPQPPRPYPPQQQQQPFHMDPYGSPIRDQWNMQPQSPYYHDPYNQGYSPQYNNYPMQQQRPSANSFRLHDNNQRPMSSPQTRPSPQQPPQPPVVTSQARRRLSESEPPAEPPSYSRQSSRDSVGRDSSPNLPPRRLHTSVPAPEETDMEPQNVSFIESSADEDNKPANLTERLSRLNITSGSKTYRVLSDGKDSSPSPTRSGRPTISSAFKQSRKGSGGESGPSSLRSNSGRLDLTEEEQETLTTMKTERLKDDADASKGFVISFDDDAPKKPKPELKPRRLSSAKKSSVVSEMSSDGSNSSRKENVPPGVMICIDMNNDSSGSGGEFRQPSPTRKYSNGVSPIRDYSYGEPSGPVIPKFDVDPSVPLEGMVALNSESESDGGKANTGLIIGDELLHADPNTQDEMQRKKERIMLQSLRRKQQAEENRIRLEEQSRKRREEDAKRDEEKARKKEEEKARKEAILEQFKVKREMEKAEEEGRRMPEPVSAKPVPRMRPKSTSKTQIGGGGPRQRPKTIHVDQDADIADSLGPSSRGPRGSSSNISGKELNLFLRS